MIREFYLIDLQTHVRATVLTFLKRFDNLASNLWLRFYGNKNV
jgi:hypothetical protein